MIDYMNRPRRDKRKRSSYRNHSRKSSGVDESRIMNIKDRVLFLSEKFVIKRRHRMRI